MVMCCTSDLLKLNYYFVDVSFHLAYCNILRATSVTCFPPTFQQLSLRKVSSCLAVIATISLGVVVICTLNSPLFVLLWHMIHII